MLSVLAKHFNDIVIFEKEATTSPAHFKPRYRNQHKVLGNISLLQIK